MRSNNDERICVVYFENARGRIVVAPDHSHPTPVGYERKEARTLGEIDRVTRIVNAQDRQMFDDLHERDRQLMEARREKTRTTLRQRLLACDCSPFERQFILGALTYLDRKEKEHQEYKYRGYFHQREFDSASDPHPTGYGNQVKPVRISDRLAAAMTS